MKAPAFQLYPQDFISSLDCQTMAPDEFGVYCWLLFHSWIQEPQCYLPNDPEKLSKLLRINPRTFAKMWRNSLEKKFKISECGNFIYNDRLKKELEKQDGYRKKQAQNGAKGGRPKANEKPKKAVGFSGLTQTEPKKSSSISSSSSTSFSGKEDKSSSGSNEPKSELSFLEMFDACRNIYPGTKRGAATEFAEFEKKCKKEFKADFFRKIYHAINTKIKTNKELEKAGRFAPEWPHLKTYLNQRRWEEETKIEPKATIEPVKEPSAFKTLEEHDDYWGGGRNPNFKPKAT